MIIHATRKLAISAAILSLCAYSAPAFAQATRTWVSGTGDDANPCSRTAPCKTFAGAISKTSAGGEINCIDSGGFGTVTITKSIVIDCGGTFGSILNAGTNGVNVNDSASGAPNTIVVRLRNLSINGAGTGLVGVSFTSGKSLILEHVTIMNNNAGSALAISFKPGAVGNLYLDDVTVNNNGLGATGGGILVAPTAGGSTHVSLNNTRVQNNSGVGIKIDATATTSANGLLATIVGSESAGNGTGLQVVAPTGSTGNNVMVTGSAFANNTTGVNADGAFAVIRMGKSNISSNTTGITATNGANNRSYGTNEVNGNITDGTFNGTPLTPS